MVMVGLEDYSEEGSCYLMGKDNLRTLSCISKVRDV
jgi:hypothetical protein